MKKLISLITSAFIIANSTIWWMETAHAASSITVSSLLINWAQVATNAFNPWNSFRVQIDWRNNGTTVITNVQWNLYFSNNSNFTFTWSNWAYVMYAKQRDIPISEYTIANWISTFITASLNKNYIWQIYEWNWNDNFIINTDTKDYVNTMYWKYTSTEAVSQIAQTTIYVNVKPHIKDYYFEKANWSQTTSQIQWWNAESVNFVLKVKDYNTCANIDWWVVTANLSKIWLSSNETLSFENCESDNTTAVFKKKWITTISPLGTYDFTYDLFYAKDEDNNSIDPNDPNTTFDDEDKKTPISLSVVSAGSPVVSKTTPSSYFVWPNRTTTSFNVSSDKDWEYSIALWSDWSCAWWTTITPWTWSGYVAWAQIPVSINQSILSEWTNKVYICFKNLTGDIWSDYIDITKDSVSPSVLNPSVTPAAVISNDTSANFACSEDWSYEVMPWSYSSRSIIANQINDQTISNALLSEWSNTITIKCIDQALNFSTQTSTVTKSTLPPSMSWSIMSFADDDIDKDWLDGNDMHLRLDNTQANNYAYFESYRLYLLPSNVDFNKDTQSHIKIITDKTTNDWTWDNLITKDSTNTNLVSWASYKMCIAIMARSWNLWTEGCSTAAILTHDYPQHPNIISAKFTTSTNLEITTDTTLNTQTWSHSWWLISFDSLWSTLTWTNVSSVNWKVINITIPTLVSPDATWTWIFADTWAIRAYSWWYNNLFSSWGFRIEDWQAPTISWLTNNTPAKYNWFFKWIINLSYNFDEKMKWWWNTYIKIARISWNPWSDKLYNITADSELSAWNHSINLNLDSLWLTSWTTYDISIVWKDLAWNQSISNTIAWIKYDNSWPSMISTIPIGTIWILNPTLSWLTTIDDSWNWAWVKSYILNVFTWSTCSGASVTYNISDPVVLNMQVNLANLNNFSWNITPVDNMDNTWTVSSCDSFMINTFNPAFSNQSITDTSINSNSYCKSLDTITIKSKVDNTDINHIWLDASSLKDSSYSNISCASPWIAWVSCSYTSNIATYTFWSWFALWLASWVKQVNMSATNISWINTWSTLMSITLDNTAPAIIWNPITSPVSSSIFWWTSKQITWNTTSISDNIAISNLKFEYSSNSWSSWNLIWTWTNSSPYNWNLWWLSDWSSYKIKITAIDQVWNETSTISDVFTLDKTAPTIWTTNLKLEKNIYKNGDQALVSWDKTSIFDINIWSNPISIFYSIDGGVSWNSWSLNSENSWSTLLNIPNTNVNNARIKLVATDIAWNSSISTDSNNYIIDSTLPLMDVLFAWGGWNTPQNWRFINNSWIDTTFNATDSYMDKVYYSLENLWDHTYWNESWNAWLWANSQNLLCADWTNLWTNSACSNKSMTLNPTWIQDWQTYRMIMKAIDEAWNEKAYNPIDYVWDTVAPNLNVNTNSWAYFSWTINISWTSSDIRSWVSAVNIEIKKWSLWWDSTSWSWSQVLLATVWNASNWNFNFTPPAWDSDWQVYDVKVHAFDSAFKVNNEAISNISLILDKTWPSISNDIFNIDTTWIKKWWDSYPIIWTQSKITTSWSPLKDITFSYNTWTWLIIPIQTITNNSWSLAFNLPLLDTNCMRIIIDAKDNLWNQSNTVASSCIAVDSLPPTVSKVETQDFNANWKIDWFKVTFSEKINHASLDISGFSASNSISLSWNYLISDTTNETILELYFSSPYWDTSSTPSISYVWTWVKDLAWNDLAAFTNKASLDSAAPRLKSADIFDTDSDWRFDKLIMLFSENLSASNDITSIDIQNWPTWLTKTNAIVSTNSISVNLTWSVSYETSSSWMILNFSNNWSYTDIAWNQAWNLSSLVIWDKADPILISAQTFWLRKVDEVRLTYSEDITNWSFTWFTLTWFPVGAFTWIINSWNKTISLMTDDTLLNTDQSWSLSYTWNLSDPAWNKAREINSYAISDKVEPKILKTETEDNDNNGKIDWVLVYTSEKLNWDVSWLSPNVNTYTTTASTVSWSILKVQVSEKANEDTSSTPDFRIIWNTSLADLNWNLITDMTTKTTIDKVWPVLVWWRYIWNIIYLSASESLSGTIAPTDFVITWSLSTINNVNYSWNQITLTMSSDPWINTDISFATWSVNDLLSNKQKWMKYIHVSSSIVINEVMYSTWNLQYIELKNLSNNPVDLTWWKIKNWWWNWNDITITSGILSASWLFLIAKTWITSLSWVTADFQTNLNLNPNTQNDLVLIDASSNIYDYAKANPWPAWDSVNWIAAERHANAGDWLQATNWYSSVVNNWLINWLKGTPNNINIFDAISPTVNTLISNNTLFPIWNATFTYTQSDNISLDTASYNFVIKDSSWTIMNQSYIVTDYVTSTWAWFHTNSLPYWRYTADYSIKDSAWNNTTKSIVFFVDSISMTVSTWSVNMSNLKSDWSIYYTQDITITIKSIWANFNLLAWWSWSMSWPGWWIWSFDGNYGYWIDYSKDENWSLTWFNWSLTTINNTSVWMSTFNPISTDWSLRTYTYIVRHWAKISPLQAAWNYNASTSIILRLSY